MKPKVSSNAGFSLIEVMLVASLMLIVSLGAAQFISSQNQQINVMEDRLSRINLSQEVTQIFNRQEHCVRLLKQVRILKNMKPQNIRIENDMGRTLFDPNAEQNHYDHLNIESAQIRNLSIQGANRLGNLEVRLDVKRLRKGGSNTQMNPVIVRLPAVVDNNSNVKSCNPQRAPICGDTVILQAGKLPDPKKDFRSCCPGGGALSDCITTGLEQTPAGNSIFYICTCE